MLEIRFHGRGGQGAVTSAELLAQAALMEGKYCQAFPSFGPERRGAPVTSFCRISNLPIRLRTSISAPDIVLVLDPSLLKAVNVSDGLKEGGILIINSIKGPEHFVSSQKLQKIATVDATTIALEILGRPITNTILLGALIKAVAPVELSSIIAAIQKRFDPKNAASNTEALHKAYEETAVITMDDYLLEKGDADAVAATGEERPADAEEQFPWTELAPGCIITSPGNSKTYHTGSWKSFYPLLTKERCIKCGVCWILCPDAAHSQDQEGFYVADLNYCKGCGICAQECPTGAITMLQEKEVEV